MLQHVNNHQLSTQGFPQLCVSDTLEVDDSKGIGPYGHFHLSGNVWEYALDYCIRMSMLPHKRQTCWGEEGNNLCFTRRWLEYLL